MPFVSPAAVASAALFLLACGSLCGCGPGAPTAPSAPGGDAGPALRSASGGDDEAEAGYLPPPRLVSVSRTPTAETLIGSAAHDARVELMAPEGETMSVRASHTGAWRLTLPAVSQPRMFALVARVNEPGPHAPKSGDRLVDSEGALILLPRSGPPALLVRAGAGALVFAARTVRPTIDAVDYDPGGFSAVAGRARPGVSVRLMMDGALAGVGEADAAGRYSILAANRRLSLGGHTALVQSADGQDDHRFTIIPPGPTLTSPYKVDPMPDGWRLEWVLPDGGVQTTLVFIRAD